MKPLKEYMEMSSAQIWDYLIDNVETISDKEWDRAIMIMYNKSNGPWG